MSTEALVVVAAAGLATRLRGVVLCRMARVQLAKYSFGDVVLVAMVCLAGVAMFYEHEAGGAAVQSSMNMVSRPMLLVVVCHFTARPLVRAPPLRTAQTNTLDGILIRNMCVAQSPRRHRGRTHLLPSGIVPNAVLVILNPRSDLLGLGLM